MEDDAPQRSGTVTRRIEYRGRVQGVGFRATAATIARRLRLAGYVRNLPGGTVELVAHGAAATVNEMLSRIADHFSGQIEGLQVDDLAAGEDFAGDFHIRR